MLKWLVTKSPSNPSSPVPNALVTEDPLAAIRSRSIKNEPIYSVSRVNPIYEEDLPSLHDNPSHDSKSDPTKIQDSPPRLHSPQTDQGSVRSSGYGSKEADSVSSISDPLHDDEILVCDPPDSVSNQPRGFRIPECDRVPSFHSSSPRTVAQLGRSFENICTESEVQRSPPKIDIVQQNSKFVKSIDIAARRTFSLESIPEDCQEPERDDIYFKRDYWPRVSHLAESLQKQTDQIRERNEEYQRQSHQDSGENKVQNLRFNPLVSVVAQDGRYVTGISVSPGRPSTENGPYRLKRTDNEDQTDSNVPLYFRQKENLTSGAEFPLLSLQPDSLINEDTLRMMHLPGYKSNAIRPHEDRVQTSVQVHDMPLFSKAIYSGLNTGLRKKPGSVQRPRSHPCTTQRPSASASKHGHKRKGIAAKDLWEKSGLKTNGRKLLGNINDAPDGERVPEIYSNFEDMKSYEYYHSMPSIIGTNPSQNHHYEDISPASSSNSLYYSSSVYCLPYKYSHFPKNGIDNPGFVHDTESPKTVPHFQHNLTEFQKRLTERLKDDLRGTGSETSRKSEPPQTQFSNFTFQKTKRKQSNTYPGKAVLEFGLSDEAWKRTKQKDKPIEGTSGETSYRSEWKNTSNEAQRGKPNPGDYGRLNRNQMWDSLYRKSLKGRKESKSYIIPPHPNNGQPFCSPTGVCQDFTLDTHTIHHLMKLTNRKEKRQRCCSVFLVLLALLCFIGAIIGISWFYTDGEKLFGSM